MIELDDEVYFDVYSSLTVLLDGYATAQTSHMPESVKNDLLHLIDNNMKIIDTFQNDLIARSKRDGFKRVK